MVHAGIAFGISLIDLHIWEFESPPPSGVTHTMFCVETAMSQVLQCTQFCALITRRSLPSSFLTNSCTGAGR